MYRLVKIINGRTNVAEITSLPTTASTSYRFGDALYLSSGKLSQCTATAKPTYIAAENYTSPASGNRSLLVYAITPQMRFEVPISASPTSLVPGSFVTVDINDNHADGVTATTTSGVCQVVDLNSATSAGDFITVRIV